MDGAAPAAANQTDFDSRRPRGPGREPCSRPWPFLGIVFAEFERKLDNHRGQPRLWDNSREIRSSNTVLLVGANELD
jgi:hypothetical protein